ncbi:hypothetical protein [Choristoneura rosaceana nucleopolyhedrovirus]|uniref:Ac19-like protein n=1 Tax=Choristoneura rosaceana nucleopolyhedrovirus TaxID=58094 RepID=S5ML07_9ABAC|nr:hypothetical protein [Choristoneura rosaceana nucleopolyhedrovirus]AGR57171.1 hypothetical protein [Choristoneura rosaceana nucleopolyhedrovirus]
MQFARLNQTNARAQQTVSMVAASGHALYCDRAIAFIISVMTGDKVNWPTLLNFFDLVVAFERNVFKKSLVLNGLVNFCIANGDGFTVQHQLLNQMLEVLMEKYY